MGRIIQPKGEKGSLKWIQEAVNYKPLLLDKPVKNFIGAGTRQSIEWLSPKADDDYMDRCTSAYEFLFGQP